MAEEELQKVNAAESTTTECFNVSKALFNCRMAPGTSLNLHVLKMIDYIDRLSRLGFPLQDELSTHLILQSLPDSYSQFIFNYKIHTTLPELLNILKLAQTTLELDKGKHVSIVNSCKVKKKVLKPKGKAMKNESDKDTCLHCRQIGHWKRNCKVYLESLKDKEHM